MEGIAIQERLAAKVSFVNRISSPVSHIARVDISSPDEQGIATGVVVILNFPDLDVVEVRVPRVKPIIPYIPRLLSFREIPVLAGVLEALSLTPDIILVDGQGFAHPRRFGLACHLGLLADTPTIGCAKSILRGKHDKLSMEQATYVPLCERGELVGAALRSGAGITPIYVPVGHKIDLDSSVRWILDCCRNLRIPEPTRLAHLAAAGRLVLGAGTIHQTDILIQAVLQS